MQSVCEQTLSAEDYPNDPRFRDQLRRAEEELASSGAACKPYTATVQQMMRSFRETKSAAEWYRAAAIGLDAHGDDPAANARAQAAIDALKLLTQATRPDRELSSDVRAWLRAAPPAG
jgi:hypothetical protein